LETKVIQNLTN